MTNLNCPQHAFFAINVPQRAYLPIEICAGSLQNSFRALGKVARFGEDLGDCILQRQPAFGALALSDVAREAAGMDKLSVFAINARIDSDVL